MDDRYFVTFTADNGTVVRVLVDEDSPAFTSGLASWEIIPRPNRKSMTRFTGIDPFQQDVPVFFDRYIDNASVEPDIALLMRMALAHADGAQPPTVRVSGLVLRPDLHYVINKIDWDTADTLWDVINGSRARLRQKAVVHLLEYVDDVVLSTATSPAVKNNGQKKNKSHTVTNVGETMKQVAQIVYGDPSKYLQIFWANSWLNPDPRAIIPKGTILNIPGQANFVVQ